MAIRPRAVAIMRRLKADFQATRAAHTAMVVTRLRLLARWLFVALDAQPREFWGRSRPQPWHRNCSGSMWSRFEA